MMRGMVIADCLWGAFFLLLILAALRTKKTQQRENVASGLSYTVIIALGFALMFWLNVGVGALDVRWLPRFAAPEIAGIAIIMIGLAFAIWARLHLKSNWSGVVTVKQGHQLIRSGPYRWVRHPIYPGVILAMAGTAVENGRWRGILGALLVFIGFWKSRKEEQFIRSSRKTAASNQGSLSIALLAIVFVWGCSTSNPNTAPESISVSLSPAVPQTIQQAQTVGITATVTGSSNNVVTWSLSGPGFLSSRAATSVTYNAPASITAVQTATVTATPSADMTKTASLTVRIELAPVPFVVQPLLPPSAAPGSGSFTLTVNGVGFATGATVEFNGAALATTFISGHQLTANVPAADVATAGTASIAVANSPGGGLSSNVVYFPITTPEANLNLVQAAGSPFPIGVVIEDMVSADFNGDGIPDLAVADAYTSAGGINILLGKGDGTFSAATGSPISMKPSPDAVVAGDFNGDGKIDLLTINRSTTSASLLLGNGDGTFTVAGAPIALAQTPSYLATGDFNGDGRLDVAISNGNNNSVTILLGNGDGTFAQVPSLPATGTSPGPIAVADFNGDGNLDLAVTNASNSVTVLLGHGDGTFTAAPNSPVPVGTLPTGIVAADFNSNGKTDLAVANGSGNSVSILLGNGDGTFTLASGSPVSVGNAPFTEVPGDFNGDGKLDLAVVNTTDNTVTFMLGNGDGTFSTITSPIIVNQPGVMVTADFNGDGRLDLALLDVFDNRVYVVLQH